MAVSESGRLINELRAAGLNFEDVGKALDRNRSLIGQISRGQKPGHNLRDALVELRDRLATVTPEARKAVARAGTTTKPAQRTTKAGKVAHVRGKTTIRGRSWASGNVRRQAARSGAKGLAKLAVEAAEAGMDLAVTVQFNKGVTVQGYSKGKRGRPGAGGILDCQLDPQDFDPQAESFTHWVIRSALRLGYLSGHGEDVDKYVSRVESIEARAF